PSITRDPTVWTPPAPREADDIREDHHSLGLSLRRHPLALLREQQRLPGCLCADGLHAYPVGRVVRVAGLVTGRQRPGSASGVTFVTREDATGNFHVVVWQATARAQRQALLTARLLQVDGILERDQGIVHVVAGRLTDQSAQLGTLMVPSRDFH